MAGNARNCECPWGEDKRGKMKIFLYICTKYDGSEILEFDNQETTLNWMDNNNHRFDDTVEFKIIEGRELFASPFEKVTKWKLTNTPVQKK